MCKLHVLHLTGNKWSGLSRRNIKNTESIFVKKIRILQHHCHWLAMTYYLLITCRALASSTVLKAVGLDSWLKYEKHKTLHKIITASWKATTWAKINTDFQKGILDIDGVLRHVIEVRNIFWKIVIAIRNQYTSHETLINVTYNNKVS